MSVTIHPHKGYLNTEFHIHLKGEKQLSYEVYTKCLNPELFTDGIAEPFKPQCISFNIPGEYEAHFSDGTVIDILVEDAYKFGGGAFKRGFVFDDCPWSFVIMYDRTYFHNRETYEEYVEPISPDEIIEVNKEYVLFTTAQQEELTLYSLTEQKPIREFSNIVFHNENYIVTEDVEDDGETEYLYLNIYSLKSKECIFKGQIERYDLCDEDFYLFKKYSVEHISLSEVFVKQIVSRKYEGRLIKVLDSSIAISYKEVGQTKNLYVYSLKDEITLNVIPIKGHLCSVNGEELIDLNSRIGAINRFDILKTDFPEASLQVQYDEYVFYNCGWEVFYEIKSHLISKSGCKWSTNRETKEFCSCGLSINVSHNFTGGLIYRHNNNLLISSDIIRELYTPIEINKDLTSRLYDFSKFEKLGMIKNKETGEEIILSKKLLNDYARYVLYESEGITSLQSMGYKYVSPNDKYAIEKENGNVYLVTRTSDTGVKVTRILQNLFDFSTYDNVLLSEDGSKIMHRNGKETKVVDVESGEEQTFKNLSYVQHINGIRPAFEIDQKRQVILINPVTGLPIPMTSLSNHSFISPDGKFYADTNLEAYIEYYNRIEERTITKSEFDSLVKTYSYPFCSIEKDPYGHSKVMENRKLLVRENLSWFKKHARNVKDRSIDEWVKFFVDEKQVFGNEYFMSYIVEKRGIAVIKKMEDDREVARISLGKPLWFLNYVSFSYDGRYVAIAGRYPNNTSDDEGKSMGGLFLCFDLKRNEVVIKETDTNAVWTTAFTKQGLLAAYSSNPVTFIATLNKEKVIELMRYSFLTFSPDGQYFALSKKGYISKDSGNKEWGHQRSTNVFICNSEDPENIICSFNDLSGNGIATLGRRKENIASVAFSNNNRQLLMVGEDGVMIIRNLHLNEDATE